MNDRLSDIDKLIYKLKPIDIIDKIKNKYKEELKFHNFIKTLDEFKKLETLGTIMYVNRFDNQLRYGGLLIKIILKNNNYVAIIIQKNKRKYFVSFNSNFIFYRPHKNKEMKEWGLNFINSINNGLITIDE